MTNVRGAPKEGEARALAAAARADRDRRIRSLAGDGWSHARIGTEVGLSDERVRQILAKPSLDERLDAAIAWLRAEISKLEREEAADRARLGPMPPVALSPEAKALVRQIDRLEEEREARELARRFDLPLAWLG